jgi:hypothetical protein
MRQEDTEHKHETTQGNTMHWRWSITER